MKLLYHYEEISIKYDDENEMQADKDYLISVGWKILLQYGLKITYGAYTIVNGDE